MREFLICQIEQAKKDPFRVLPKKIGRFLLLILVLPIIAVIRLISPWILIRFGQLPSSRLGPFSMCPELYFCERDQGLQPKSVDFFYCNNEKIANSYLKKMWGRLLHVSSLTKTFISASKLLPGHKRHGIELPHEHDYRALLATTERTHIYFTDEEKEKGKQFLVQRGVSTNQKFVCFASRDSVYLNTVQPQNNWDYHNYRDFNIHDCLPAAEELTKRGYTLFRMGAIVQETLKTDNPRIIDYATQFRNEFLDIFLLGSCRFYLGSLSGINSVSMIFRRPKAVVNAVPMETVHTWMPNDLFIPKKIWHHREGRFLTFEEMLDSNIGGFHRGDQYAQHDLEVVNNTAEEIMSLAVEMDERLNGIWQTAEGDEALQEQFREIFRRKTCHRKILARIGRNFLRQNRWLLEGEKSEIVSIHL